MNRKTLVRFVVRLSCTHTVMFDVKPEIQEWIYCTRCDSAATIREVEKR